MDIDIKGDIIEDENKMIYEWFGWNYTTARNVINALKKADGEAVNLKINSPGGSVFAASEIYTELMNYKGDVNIQILGLAASAASVIAMAGRSKMSSTALMMVHNTSTGGVSGDYRVMEHTAEFLKTANQTIASAYVRKSGMSEDEALALMDRETWLTAEKAKELKLIDEVMFEENNIINNQSFKGLQNSFSTIPQNILEQLEMLQKNNINQNQPKNDNKNDNQVDFLIKEKAKAQAKLNLLKLGGNI